MNSAHSAEIALPTLMTVKCICFMYWKIVGQVLVAFLTC